MVELKKNSVFQNIQLDDLDGAMEFFQDCMILYVNNDLSERSLRALTYALRGYLDYLRHRDDLAIEDRLAHLEDVYHGWKTRSER